MLYNGFIIKKTVWQDNKEMNASELQNIRQNINIKKAVKYLRKRRLFMYFAA
jgi:hypothetical protein